MKDDEIQLWRKTFLMCYTAETKELQLHCKRNSKEQRTPEPAGLCNRYLHTCTTNT